MLMENGKPIDKGELETLTVAPGASAVVQINLPPQNKARSEYHLNIYARLRDAAPLLPQNHLLAYEQFQLTTFIPAEFTNITEGITVTKKMSLSQLMVMNLKLELMGPTVQL